MSQRIVKNYVNGRWISPKHNGTLPVTNPSTGEILADTPISTKEEVQRAIESANQAFPLWSRTPAPNRVEPLFKLAALLKENEEKITRVLVAEMGKSLPDARAEIKRTVQNVEVACGIPNLQMGEKLLNSAPNVDGEVLRLPIGVFAMIAPFNFPAMVPFWFLPYAIATGNTFILKPSERVPLTMEIITQYIDQIGLPPGVFNVVNGDRTVSETLLDSPQIQGISFVGSSNVAKIVAKKCVETGKRFQALGSAKNHLVVMPDAKMDHVIRNMITSCYGCAGQRCMASSVIVCVGDVTYQSVIEKYVSATQTAIVADPLDPKVANEPIVIGPVISAEAKERIEQMIEEGINEGAKLVIDGRGYEVAGSENGNFVGPTVFIDVKPGMKIHSDEIFGPVVVIMKVDSLDEAITIINQHQYGNGASIYTQDGFAARKFKLETKAGMIGINIGIPAPVAYLPFGGMRGSIFSDIKAQGKSIIRFYTEEKIITERFWD